MKMKTLEVIQHISATAMLGFSLSYILFRFNGYNIELGIIAWVFSLLFLYFPNFLTIPGVSKEEMNDAKVISIFSGWFLLFFLLWQLSRSTSLLILTVVFFILLILSFIYQMRKWRKTQHSKKSGKNDS
ncbi:MAG: hypothetical protein HXS54_14720 [Theionarchaea archaeon]|nr:hypothetical protein [Theionarchaea archaeon]